MIGQTHIGIGVLRRVGTGLAAILFLGLAACGGDAGAPQGAATPSADDAGYMAPPSLTGAARRGPSLLIEGRAPATAQVQLISPDGRTFEAASDGAGAWRIQLPAPQTPQMFAFVAQVGDRAVRGEGAVLITPAPGPAALLLRPGFGALSLGAPQTTPRIVAVDYDATGGTAVAGLARPGAAVRLSIEGAAVGLGQADSLGRFAVVATNRTLEPGARRIVIDAEQSQAQALVQVSPPEPLGAAPYRASPVRGGWRIDWAPPGGGVQTSVVFNMAGVAP